ncbi:MAG: hypothetical protein MZW92_12140 [Comamonadaceae bacterium]|nr:hypothetical protein [Comamonadaceae bacterium]
MNQRSQLPIPDVQATPDVRRLAIDKVGIKSIRHPMRILERAGGGPAHGRHASTCTWACRTSSRARTCRGSWRSSTPTSARSPSIPSAPCCARW